MADGDLWKAGSYTRSRPEDGPYLTCDDRDWRIRCGIESWFVGQDEAAELEDDVGDGAMVAVIKVDGRGHAAIVASRRTDMRAGRRLREGNRSSQRNGAQLTARWRVAQPPATAGITEIWVPSGVGVARLSRNRTSSLPT